MAKCVTTVFRFTSGQTYPQERHLVAKCVITSVRMTTGKMDPQDEALGQVDI